MKNIAITGISGYIGSKLFCHLESMDSVQSIIGIDTKQPTFESYKLRFYHQDILKPFGDLFVENDVDTAVHSSLYFKTYSQ